MSQKTSKKASTLRFNKTINKFLEELQKILPGEKDIPIFQSQIDVTLMFDESKVLKSFIQFVSPYKQQIIDKDEKFFLGDNVEIEKDYMSQAIHLTDLWKNKLSNENKLIVWKYFQVLVILADKHIKQFMCG